MLYFAYYGIVHTYILSGAERTRTVYVHAGPQYTQYGNWWVDNVRTQYGAAQTQFSPN
jgi:hypothetical protein